MLLEWSGYPSEQPRQQTIFYDSHRRATFPRSSLDRVVLFPEVESLLRRKRHSQSSLYHNTDGLPLRYTAVATIGM